MNPLLKDRPLARAGIKPHDLIVSCDGLPLRRLSTFLGKIREKPANSTFRLEVLTPGSALREVILTTDSIEAGWR